MPGNLTDTSENAMLDWILGVGTPTRPTTPMKLAAVTAIGTETVAGTEVVGGSYARQNFTPSAASGGASSNSGAISFTNMPVADILGVEVWDSAGSPVRYWHAPLAGVVGTSQNTGDTITSNSHGFADGDKVAFTDQHGYSVPAGLTADTVYFVVSSATNTFQVAATSGGAAIAITADGTNHYAIKVKSTGSGDTFSIAASSLAFSLD